MIKKAMNSKEMASFLVNVTEVRERKWKQKCIEEEVGGVMEELSKSGRQTLMKITKSNFQTQEAIKRNKTHEGREVNIGSNMQFKKSLPSINEKNTEESRLDGLLKDMLTYGRVA